MQTVNLIRLSWEQLGPDARSYARMTTNGIPTGRVVRTLFTRIFDAECKHAVGLPTVDDPRIVASVQTQVLQARDRLERVAHWHKSLRDAFYRLPKEDRFWTDPVERLFSHAWEEAGRGDIALSEHARAHDALMRIAAKAAGFSAITVDRVLADPVSRADLQRSLEKAWDDADHARRGLQTDETQAAELEALVASLIRELVPRKRQHTAAAESVWATLKAADEVGKLKTAMQLALTDHDEVRPPSLVSSEETATDEDRSSLWVRPFRPLDASVRDRIGRILRNPPFPFELAPTAWDGLEIAVRVSAVPYGLGQISSRAALVIGARAYTGLAADLTGGTEKGRRDIDGAISYLARCWRASEGVASHLAAGGGVAYAPVRNFVDNPQEYALARLWVRFSRTDFDGHNIESVADLWWHIKEVVTKSAANHVKELTKRVARERLRFYDADSEDGQIAEEKHAVKQWLQRDVDEEPHLTVQSTGSGKVFAAVISYAVRNAGRASVEEFLASHTGRAVASPDETALAERWEGWAMGASVERVRHPGKDDGPFESERSQARAVEQLEEFPTYAQVREWIRAQLNRAAQRTHDERDAPAAGD